MSKEVKPLTLIFNTEDFTNKEIAEVIAFLNSIYNKISGDELEIIGATTFEINNK